LNLHARRLRRRFDFNLWLFVWGWRLIFSGIGIFTRAIITRRRLDRWWRRRSFPIRHTLRTLRRNIRRRSRVYLRLAVLRALIRGRLRLIRHL